MKPGPAGGEGGTGGPPRLWHPSPALMRRLAILGLYYVADGDREFRRFRRWLLRNSPDTAGVTQEFWSLLPREWVAHCADLLTEAEAEKGHN